MTTAIMHAPPPAAASIGGAIAQELAADVLLAIVDGERAWSSLEDLAVAMGKGDDAAAVAIRAAESLGLVEFWPDCPQGPAWTLSPESADRLGVAIGPDGKFHRSTSPMADGNYVGGRSVRRPDDTDDEVGEAGGSFGWHIDPRAIDPALAVEEAEQIAILLGNRQVARLLAGTAMACDVIGIRPAWPVIVRDGICPGCGTGPKGTTVCLACDRAGFDLLLNPRRQ